ncbi:hypothetical protein K1719_038878 [Acacia pycnantha]|nr:hypothetical protein K1719_038878 [Acacia pycnantha]
MLRLRSFTDPIVWKEPISCYYVEVDLSGFEQNPEYIFGAVLRADPNFDDLHWPTVSAKAKDFIKRLLNKDYRKRMTSVQALSLFSYLFTHELWRVLIKCDNAGLYDGDILGDP